MNAFDDLSPPDLEGSSEESSDSNRTNEEMKALFRGNFGRVRTQQVKFFFLCHLFNKCQRSFALVLGVVFFLNSAFTSSIAYCQSVQFAYSTSLHILSA